MQACLRLRFALLFFNAYYSRAWPFLRFLSFLRCPVLSISVHSRKLKSISFLLILFVHSLFHYYLFYFLFHWPSHLHVNFLVLISHGFWTLCDASHLTITLNPVEYGPIIWRFWCWALSYIQCWCSSCFDFWEVKMAIPV